jgi:cell division protein FtsB
VRKKETNTARRLLPYVVGGVFVFLALVFLPGPNGLIKVLSRRHQLGSLRRQLGQTDRRIDSLETWRSRLEDPEFATEYARRCLGQPPVPDTTQPAQ